MFLVGRRDSKTLITFSSRKAVARCFFFFFLCISSLSLPAALKRCTCSFHLARCSLPLKQRAQIFSKLSKETLQNILSQKFRYLDRGAQSFVFASEDGLYVLKLFFFDPSVGLAARCLGRSFEWNAKEKAEKLIESCKMASLAFEETALIYLHLGPSDEAFPQVRLVGPVWKRSLLNCARYCFALQLRAEPFKKSLQSAYVQKDRNAFSERLHAFYSLLQNRIAMGIHNSDSDLFRNFGFINKDRAIEIDFGNYRVYRECDEMKKKRELACYKTKLIQWVNEVMPDWSDEVEQ